MTSDLSSAVDEPTWFGRSGEPLFGILSTPSSGQVRGGIVIAPPVGFEARGAGLALRGLAVALAARGFIVLRFDYRGTGDSSGDFGTSAPDPQWMDDVASAVQFLREGGADSVSVVGMRLGATLAALAASQQPLHLTSLVLWDPCESGRSYLRELRALESLRRQNFNDGNDGSVETVEFRFPGSMATSLRSLSLSQSNPSSFAQRALVISRAQRPLSVPLNEHLSGGKTEFATTKEQEALLGVAPFFATSPSLTIELIATWLEEADETAHQSVALATTNEAVVEVDSGGGVILERAIKLGSRELFAIVTQPRNGGRGPWIVMLAGLHEDHKGPSRQWVQLSRRWARAGLRCVRLDVSGMGESHQHAGDPPLQSFNPVWIDDVNSAILALEPTDPSNCVYVGVCSGAFLALESALRSRARGVCVINPPIGTNYIHAITRLQMFPSATARRIAQPMKRLLDTHHWVGAGLWQEVSRILPRRWATDVMKAIKSNGTDIYVLGSLDDLSPYPRVPIVRSIEGRRIDHVKPYPFMFVPEMDHDMSVADGRDRAAHLLDEHIRTTYATASSNTSPPEDT